LKVIHPVTSLKVGNEFLIKGKCLPFNLTALILSHHKARECYWEHRETEMKHPSLCESHSRNSFCIAMSG